MSKLYIQESSLIRRVICTILHGKKARQWHRGLMGWVDWEKCEKCGSIHNVC